MPEYTVQVCQFPYGGMTHYGASDWLAATLIKMEHDPRIKKVVRWKLADTPVTMCRNRALLDAERAGADYVLMLDSDNIPDLYVGDECSPNAKPFWDTAWEFALAHQGPCCIAAPYCGPPPRECCYIFQWVNRESEHANPDFSIEMVSRAEAAKKTGIERAAALPTGVMLIDMRGVKRLRHPRFDYEWKDETQCEKATTEDVFFTRNLTYAGVPCYAAWDCWAGHAKTKIVGKPLLPPLSHVPRLMRRMAAGTEPMDESVAEREIQRTRVRPVNTYAKLPPGYVTTRAVVMEEEPRLTDADMEERAALVGAQAELDGAAVGNGCCNGR